MKRLIEVLRVIVLVVMAGYDEYTFKLYNKYIQTEM